MKFRFKAITILLILSFILPCITCVKSEGINLAVAPGVINIEEAFRNATYKHPVFIYNQNDFDNHMKLNISGSLSEWVEIYSSGSNNTIDSIDIKNNSDRQIIVKINVPASAENRLYKDFLMVTANPQNTIDNSTNSSALHLSTPVLLVVNVTGDQIVNASVQQMNIIEKKIEMGNNVTFKTEVINNGNVRTKLNIDIEIFNKEGIKVDNLSETTNYIQPTYIYKSYLRWSTVGKIAGNYTAKFNITSLSGKVIDKKEIIFEILPFGTLERKGILKEIYHKGVLKKGNAVKIIAVFKNNGEADVLATFYADVYKNGNLLDSIQSQKVKVEKYKEVELESVLKIQENADYSITGHVEYEGVETEEIKYDFVVKEELPYNIIFLLSLITIILILLYYLSKKYKLSFNFFKIFKLKIKALTSSNNSKTVGKELFNFRKSKSDKPKRKIKFRLNNKNKKIVEEKNGNKKENSELNIEEMSAEEIEKYVESL